MAQGKAPDIRSSTVRFANGISAFRALPAGKGRRPGVILLHERYGVVEHTKDLTLRLARAGYAGLAPDLFSRFTGDRKALEQGNARMHLNDGEVLEDLGVAMSYLKKLTAVDSSRIGIMGVCQTGRHSLLLAAHRNDINNCVIFYGGIGGKEWTTDELRPEPLSVLVENLSCPLLGVFGEADHLIPVENVLRFRALLEAQKKSYRIRIYPQAPHGWLNDTMPGRYRKQAARDAWQLLLSFLKESFTKSTQNDRVLWNFTSDTSPNYDSKQNVRLE